VPAESPAPGTAAASPLAPHAARLAAAIPLRRSRRSYDGVPVAAADLDALDEFTRAFRPYRDARAVVLREAPQSVFAGIVGAYGGVSGAPCALVFVGAGDYAPEDVGYTGEAAVLEATALGLGTCWVAGTFSKHATADVVTLAPDERVVAISPLGHPVEHPTVKERVLFGVARAKHRRSLEEIAPGHDGWPAWAQAAVAAARIAPSAMNRQPWRFRMAGGGLVVSTTGVPTPRTSLRLDCGIAMLHAELGARSEGVGGCWEPLAGSDVARFVPV
jgi:nitroreductase